jgi:hypothetical protein
MMKLDIYVLFFKSFEFFILNEFIEINYAHIFEFFLNVQKVIFIFIY